MKAILPWLRSLVSFPLGLLAIQLFHLAGRQFFPLAYGNLDSDTARLLALTLVNGAGIAGSFVVGAVARHRIWLHMAIFLALMLAIDIAAIVGALATQPIWFKVLVIATLSLQVWVGARLAMLTYRKGSRPLDTDA